MNDKKIGVFKYTSQTREGKPDATLIAFILNIETKEFDRVRANQAAPKILRNSESCSFHDRIFYQRLID